MSKDTPSGDGDYEYLHMYTLDESCSNPTGVRATSSGVGESWPVHIDVTKGFWCVNSEQASNMCEDFSVQFCCPKSATGDCSADGYSWSDFYDNDDPDNSGDWELRSDEICANPIAVKAETLSGSDFDAQTHIDNEIGFWCLNDENLDTFGCEDYRVSFCCPEKAEGTCEAYGYSWGKWLDIDDPDGLGDMEVKTSFSEFEVCEEPSGIKAQVKDGEESDAYTRISTHIFVFSS